MEASFHRHIMIFMHRFSECMEKPECMGSGSVHSWSKKFYLFFHAQYLRRTRTELEHQRIYNLNFFFPSLSRKLLHFQHQYHVIRTLIRSLIYSSFISAILTALVLLIITLRWHKSKGNVYTMDGDKVSSLHTCRMSEKSQDKLNPDMIFYVYLPPSRARLRECAYLASESVTKSLTVTISIHMISGMLFVCEMKDFRPSAHIK